jgi:HlyD family secretion protein
VLALAIAVTAAAWAATRVFPRRNSPVVLDAIEWAVARRVDLDTNVLVGGELVPFKETTVTCQVEDVTDSDGVVIVSMIADGTQVKKGDELCVFDSSQLEELARQEEIAAIQARSADEQTRLALEVARISLREYQEGQVLKLTKEFEGRIALASSDYQSQVSRVSWTESMSGKGYASKAQLITERQSLEKTRHELRKAEGEFELFRNHQAPKQIVGLRGQIGAAESNHSVESMRLKAQEERLAHTRKQIENCRVLAPHDGFAILASKRNWWATPLDPGVRVHQNQELFKIPDLTRMDVEVSVHETVGHRVRVGMKARVRFASMPDREFHGHIASIIPFPVVNAMQWDERIRHYIARVRMDEIPSMALPKMSAVVEIDTGRVQDALVIPVASVSVVNRLKSCYVRVANGVARRAITIGSATSELLEVTGGLSEGEQVVSRFSSIDSRYIISAKETPP